MTYQISTPNINYSNIVVSGNGSSGSASYTATAATWSMPDPRVNITGGDIIMDGVSLKDTLQGIQDRLVILQPKPELLERYEALKQAYEHYKTLESLVQDTEKPDNK